MRQILRFYMRHDLDLIGLRIQGVNMAQLGKIALESYANNKQIKVRIPPGKELNLEDMIGFLKNKGEPVTKSSRAKSSTSFKCEFTTNDEEAIKLLKRIKNTYRNQFIKSLIRNTLNDQALIPFFTKIDDINKENRNLSRAIYINNEIAIPMMDQKINPKDYLKAAKTDDFFEESEEVLQEKLIIQEATTAEPYTPEINVVNNNADEKAEIESIPSSMPVSPIEDLDIEEINETLTETATEDIEAMFDSLMNDL